MRRFTVALSVGVLFLAGIVVAQTSPLAGTWKLNVTKSKFSPGPGPKSQTLKWERVQGGFRFTTDATSADNTVTHTVTMLKDDGSDAPVQGAASPTTRHLKRIDDRTYEDGDKVNGKPTVSRRLGVAQDGRTLTVTVTGTNAQGQPVNNVTVYDRQ